MSVLIGVLGVLFLSWLLGVSVDIEPVNPEACLKACTVNVDHVPAWVRTAIFDSYDFQFYDWSQLDPVEWQRLRAAIGDFYRLVGQRPLPPRGDTPEHTLYELALVGTGDVTDFEASVRVLLLMVYSGDVYNHFDRYKAYIEKVDRFVKRYEDMQEIESTTELRFLLKLLADGPVDRDSVYTAGDKAIVDKCLGTLQCAGYLTKNKDSYVALVTRETLQRLSRPPSYYNRITKD